MHTCVQRVKEAVVRTLVCGLKAAHTYESNEETQTLTTANEDTIGEKLQLPVQVFICAHMCVRWDIYVYV